MTITTTPGNTAPVANAGPDQTVQLGATVTLNGSGSNDVDGNPLTYQWAFVTVPTGSTAKLSSPTIVMPTFVADLAGQYVVKLLVNDGKVDEHSGHRDHYDDRRQYRAGRQCGTGSVGAGGSTVTLNGSGSTDADKNTLTYDWSFVSISVRECRDVVEPDRSRANLCG